MKKVSIIIPSYNTKPEELEACLASCFRQGLQECEFEILLIDDGSACPPSEIYAKWTRSHANVRFFEQENSGLSHTRNRGVDLAEGEYLCFVDSDDYLLDGTLSCAFAEAKKDDLEVAYYHGYPPPQSGREDVLPGSDFLKEFGFRSGVWLFLVKTKFLKKSKIRFYEKQLCEDGVFAYELLCVAKRVRNVRKDGRTGYFYRLSADSIQRTNDRARKIKFIETGFLFAANFFNKQLENSCGEKSFSSIALRCRNYYLLLLLFRLLDADIPDEVVGRVFSVLRANKMFPFSRENVLKGRKFKLLHFLLNGRLRFALFRKLFSCKKIFGIAVFTTGATSFRAMSKRK